MSKTPAQPRKKQLAKEYMRAYPGASTAEVVAALRSAGGVSPRTVANARQELRQESPEYRSYFDRTSPTLDTEAPAPPEPTDPEVTAVETGSMTLEERKERLSRMARAAQADRNATTAIAAMGALDRIEAREGAKEQLGPPEPLTLAQKIDYTVLTLECAGPDVTGAALVEAFTADELETLLESAAKQIAAAAETA